MSAHYIYLNGRSLLTQLMYKKVFIDERIIELEAQHLGYTIESVVMLLTIS